MYQYTVTIAYGGANAFVIFLWNRLTRGAGFLTFTFTSDQATVSSLRTSGTQAGFIFSNITRIPVSSPEIVP